MPKSLKSLSTWSAKTISLTYSVCMSIKCPSATNVELKFNNATVFFFWLFHGRHSMHSCFCQKPRHVEEGSWMAEGHQGCDLPGRLVWQLRFRAEQWRQMPYLKALAQYFSDVMWTTGSTRHWSRWPIPANISTEDDERTEPMVAVFRSAQPLLTLLLHIWV